jgi:hypothetical protein
MVQVYVNAWLFVLILLTMRSVGWFWEVVNLATAEGKLAKPS